MLMYCMQGRTSSIPEVYAFSVQALAACEALIHPRCNQPWPSPAASQQPARNGRATDAVEYLGVPRMWASSALETGTWPVHYHWEKLHRACFQLMHVRVQACKFTLTPPDIAFCVPCWREGYAKAVLTLQVAGR